MQASSPGTHAEPQMVHALVHARQASCPSTRTGSTGGLAHMGQSSKIDAFQLSAADGPATAVADPLPTWLVQVRTEE
ncbi:hypothetical protein HZU40_00080 (plasmid) [Mycolicibacterium fluoranthenivorans]|uniref:Uncharacterized protein n=1 Tax=Mycolicibacterium fluoranthenivorans TaxID=258505 RepID=A0A7G8P6E0_9MYCO|nr:hypothetical protein [Mycolicibacterium fluoranthenivorans]QNJ89906.1 hypothetical protein HZU40_00080 [Mycolicibacterium fluoranthenivorans]